MKMDLDKSQMQNTQLAYMMLTAGKAEAAVNILKQLEARSPENAMRSIMLFDAYLKTGRLEEARLQAKRFSQYFPDLLNEQKLINQLLVMEQKKNIKKEEE